MARLRPAAVLALVAAGALAALALAAGGSSRTRSTTVASFDSSGLNVHCAGSQRLVLGGVKASTSHSEGLVISAVHPHGTRALRVAATNVFVNPAGLSATAYCTHRQRLSIVTKSVKVPAADAGEPAMGSVGARCPGGTVVRLGGFSAAVSAQPAGPSVVVNRMKRTGRRTLTVAAANAGDRPGKLEAIAGCGSGPAPSPVKTTVGLPAAGGRAKTTARCPSGLRLVFGGFQTRSNDGQGPYLRELARPSAGRWRVGAFQFKRPHAVLKAIAYCG
ncbi:MAG: hypothetical protein QOJ01_1497 [Solirubrobacterales bacterium]|jgi:hypothetical protein|nr:hypothetical protein [Solirubrobacterales bacterium]